MPYSGPFANPGGYSNAGTTSEIIVDATSFAGNLANVGTITPGGAPSRTGIRVENGSVISGMISNAGAISVGGVGIQVGTVSTPDHSVVTAGVVNAKTGTIRATIGVLVVDVSFAGGISNAGTISSTVADGRGILVAGFYGDVSTFLGGITNAGKIASPGAGISVTSVSQFGASSTAGAIVNNGIISGTVGIIVNGGETFIGGITNTGTVSATVTSGIRVTQVTSFFGGITNAGLISVGAATSGGVRFGPIGVDHDSIFSGGIGVGSAGLLVGGVSGIGVRTDVLFAGGISNGGVITSALTGINESAETFSGGITNSGTISANVGILVTDAQTFGGGLINGGTISAGGVGIQIGAILHISGQTVSAGVASFGGDIVNSGSITGRTGILIGPGGASVGFAAGDGIVNSGTIIGTSGTAIDDSGAAGPVDITQLAGTVSGAVKLSDHGDVLTVSGGEIVGNIVGGGGGAALDFNLGAGAFRYANTVSGVSTVALNTGLLVLAAGANVSGVAVGSGATLELLSGAMATYSIGTGGALAIAGGATLSGYAVAPTTIFQVLAGGTASAATVSSGAEEYVGGSGTALATRIESGGTEAVFGTDDGAVVNGVQYDFAVADDATVASGGLQYLESGTTGNAETVARGGEQYIASNAAASSTVIEAGGAEVVVGADNGGAAISGTQYDFGTASGGAVYAGGFQWVEPGGAAVGATVQSGGQQYIGSGGTALATVIAPQGVEVVIGADSGALVSGTQYVFGVVSGGTTFDGGSQQVASGATATGMAVSSGGLQFVGSSGTTIGTMVEAFGAEETFGTDRGALISGTQYDFGAVSGGTVFANAFQWIEPGAIATAMTISSGGQQYIGSGGTALATDIAAQGAEVIFGGDSGALVRGTQYVFGVASGGTTFDGGSQQVEAGSTAIGMTLSAGGQQDVGAGGTAIGTDILDQGAELVRGTDLGAAISGTQYVYGLASGTVAASGGYQLVGSGGTISAASISGGTIELTSAASVGPAPISFAGAGELILDASALFSGSIAGFDSAGLNDGIDFTDIPFVASGPTATTVAWSPTASASGTLMVSEGGHSADIALLGQYTGTFSPSADSQGGTLITYTSATATADFNSPVLATHAAIV